MEADYYEPEIWYYAAPLPRGGRRGALPHPPLGPGAADLRRPRVEGAVRGRRELRGHGRRDAALVRRGDRARRGWSPTGCATPRTSRKLPPATEFIQRAFARAVGAQGDHLPRHVARRAGARARPRPARRRAQQPARRRREHGRDLHRRGRRRRPRPRHRRAPAATATCSRTRSSSCSATEAS